MNYRIIPLTPDLWPALEDLFGPRGACSGCWCMYWRIGAAYRKQPEAANKAASRQVVESGPPPGLLAFEGDLAVGWCQLTPRASLPQVDRSWRLRHHVCARRLPHHRRHTPPRPIMRRNL